MGGLSCRQTFPLPHNVNVKKKKLGELTKEYCVRVPPPPHLSDFFQGWWGTIFFKCWREKIVGSGVASSPSSPPPPPPTTKILDPALYNACILFFATYLLDFWLRLPEVDGVLWAKEVLENLTVSIRAGEKVEKLQIFFKISLFR